MKTPFFRRPMAALAVATTMAAIAAADPAFQLDIVRGGFPNATFGAYVLGETEPSTETAATNPLRDAGSFAVSPNKSFSLDGQSFFVGGVSNGVFDNAGGAAVEGKNDLIGFRIVEDPAVLGVIDVTRRVVANAPGGSGVLSAIAVGGVSNTGLINIRVDPGSGGLSTSGLVSATSNTKVVFGSSFLTPTSGASAYTALAARTTTAGNTLSIPAIGGNSLVTLTSSFNKEIVAASPTLPAPYSSTYLPKAKVLAAIATTDAEDNRGSIAYNGAAGIAAIYRLTVTGTTGTTNIRHVTGVSIYRVSVLANGNVELRDLNNTLTTKGSYYAFPTAVKVVNGKSFDLFGTNFFSSSTFAGPSQISINDNGDIAVLTVAGDKTDTTDNQERGAQDKRYLVARRTGLSSYASWITAAQSGTNSTSTQPNGDIINTPGTGNFVTLNPLDDPANPLNSVAAGSPSLDNDGNVYFTAATEADFFANGGGTPFTTVRTAIFRARPSGASTFAVERVIAEGDVLTDPNDLSERTVTFLPLAVATSSLSNANIRYPARNSIQPNSSIKDSLGGFTVALKISDPNDSSAPTRWSFLYVAFK